MTRKVRTHLPLDTATPASMVPKHLSRQEFGRRLYQLMLAKGWHQSELARQAGITRDAVSTYINGRSLPTPTSLAGLARAFGIASEELLPNVMEAAIDEDNPAFEMKAAAGAPGKSWIRVNRLVTTATAIKIADLLERDRVLDREGSGDAA